MPYFLTGAATYYRHEINLWMQPQFATIQVKQDTAMESAYQYLQKNAADAQSWYIGVASPSSPVNKIYWQKADGGYENKTWMRTRVKKSPYLQLKAVSFSMAFTISCMVCPILSVGF